MTDEELSDLIDLPDRRREISATELATKCLERIERHDRELKTLITVSPELALRDARALDLMARRRRNQLLLRGMPIVVKDNIDVGGIRSTAGSRSSDDQLAVLDSEVVRNVRVAGGVVLGKANMHELAFGGTTNNAVYGTCRNPWDRSRIPGGSSGGCAAALAADFCIGALGTDTGGSIRLPAGFCGVAGLRPSFGLVSTEGVFPLSASLDTVGPMSRSARDVASLLAACSDGSGRDSALLDSELRDLVVGYVEAPYFGDRIESDVDDCVRAARDVLVDCGAQARVVQIDGFEQAFAACSRIILFEAFALHRKRYRDRPELFSEATRERLAIAERVTSADYAESLLFAAEWRFKLTRIFTGVDVLVSPVTPFIAPTIAEAEALSVSASLAWATYPWSLGHAAAMSVPCGFCRGLPVGMQLIAASSGDWLVIRAAAAYQAVTQWHTARATLPN